MVREAQAVTRKRDFIVDEAGCTGCAAGGQGLFQPTGLMPPTKNDLFLAQINAIPRQQRPRDRRVW
ncbi:MAG: hypothetical protein B7Y41_10330 [Hydrogenophilales bacterium 28-61-23]|nr:MAG: hypothetical protein B7Y41_10330 [Hydrogenophilales bacterium 28-61-23]